MNKRQKMDFEMWFYEQPISHNPDMAMPVSGDIYGRHCPILAVFWTVTGQTVTANRLGGRASV